MTRGVSTKYSEARIIQACELRERGLSTRQIELRTGIPRSTVEWHCIKAGAEPPVNRQKIYNRIPVRYRNGAPILGFSETEDLKLREMNEAGMRLCDMATALKRNPSSVRNRLMALARHDARAELQEAAQ